MPDMSEPARSRMSLGRGARVGQVVLKLRRGLGLTQTQVANRAGISRVLVAKVETGRHQLTTVVSLEAIARGLGITTEQLRSALANGQSDPPVKHLQVEELRRALFDAATALERLAEVLRRQVVPDRSKRP